jgi:hypothetical protein
MTINEGLTLQKVIRSRISSLEELRREVSTKETYFLQSEKIKEPLYSVQDVDAKITKLQDIQFRLDNAIKQANSCSLITGGFDQVAAIVFESLT